MSILRKYYLIIASIGFVACNQPSYQGRGLSTWINDLESSSKSKKQAACEALATFGSVASEATDKLVKLIEKDEDSVKDAAAMTLSKIGEAARAPLEKLLNHDEPMVRLYAAVGLVRLDPAHKAASDALVGQLVGVGNALLSKRAGDALVAMQDKAVPALVARFSDSYPPARLEVIRTAGRLRAAGVAAFADLTRVAKEDKDSEVRRQAVMAMAQVAPREQAEPVLTSFLKDNDESVGAAAGAMLRAIGAREEVSGNEGVPDPPPPPVKKN